MTMTLPQVGPRPCACCDRHCLTQLIGTAYVTMILILSAVSSQADIFSWRMLPIQLLWHLLQGCYCPPHNTPILFCLQEIMTMMRAMSCQPAVSMQMSKQPTRLAF